jgi:hypothetical protein
MCTVLYCTVLLPPGDNPIAVNKYIKCISASAQRRPLFQTRQFVSYSVVCDSCVEGEPGENVAECPGSAQWDIEGYVL